MSVNNAIFHRTISHHLRVQRYSLGANDEFNQILAEAYDQIRQVVADNSAVIDSQNTDSSEYAAMLAAIFTIWEDTKPALQDAMETALQEFAANEVENEIATLQDEIPADVALQVPSEEEIAQIVADAAFQGRTLDTWLEDFKAADLSRIKAVIVGGMQAGENAGSIAEELTAGTFQTGFNMLGNIVRTVWNGITNWARLLVVAANKDAIPQVVWLAVLDDSTCLICSELDGEIFSVDEVDPPPIHGSCRCVLVAIVAHHSKLAQSKQHKKAMRYVKPADRAQLDGKPPPRIKYGAWLKAQPASVQDEALGPKRGRLFRIGKLQLSRFVGRHHKILTLAELKKNDRAAWKRAGLE